MATPTSASASLLRPFSSQEYWMASTEQMIIAVVGVLANNNLPVMRNKSGTLLSGLELRCLLLARTPTTAIKDPVAWRNYQNYLSVRKLVVK